MSPPESTLRHRVRVFDREFQTVEEEVDALMQLAEEKLLELCTDV
jgi:hypothetical protein